MFVYILNIIVNVCKYVPGDSNRIVFFDVVEFDPLYYSFHSGCPSRLCSSFRLLLTLLLNNRDHPSRPFYCIDLSFYHAVRYLVLLLLRCRKSVQDLRVVTFLLLLLLRIVESIVNWIRTHLSHRLIFVLHLSVTILSRVVIV